VGKKRATVANFLRLLNLPREVQLRVEEGVISMGHARALLALDSPEKQRALCRKIVEQGLSVRQVEKLTANGGNKEAVPAPVKDPNVAAIEDDLRLRFGTRVNLRASKKNRGKIEIEFFNLDELERLLELLRHAG
jgi:ParB family chromosome partitioning protein